MESRSSEDVKSSVRREGLEAKGRLWSRTTGTGLLYERDPGLTIRKSSGDTLAWPHKETLLVTHQLLVNGNISTPGRAQPGSPVRQIIT